jgi:hypothetical protein
VAKQTYVELVDDIDGGQAHETVKFGLDGLSFEIDLSNKNAAKLRGALQTYVDNGTRISGRTAAGRGSAHRPVAAEREQNQAIRAWAARKGLEVAARGRIAADIIDQYNREAGRNR